MIPSFRLVGASFSVDAGSVFLARGAVRVVGYGTVVAHPVCPVGHVLTYFYKAVTDPREVADNMKKWASPG